MLAVVVCLATWRRPIYSTENIEEQGGEAMGYTDMSNRETER